MLKNKRSLILLFLVLVVGSIVYLYFQTTPQQQNLQNTPIPTPRVPGNLQSEINFNFPQSLTVDIPPELMLFTVERGSIESSIGEALASDLKFTAEPRVINDPVYGTTYLWSEPPKALSIKFRDRIINYVSGAQLGNLQTGFGVAESQIIDTSRNFVEAINSRFSLKLEPGKVTYYLLTTPETEKIVTPQNANLAEISYATYLEGFPIIGSPVLLSPSSRVLITRNLDIYSANLTLPPSQLIPFEHRTTLTFEEMKNISPSEAKLIDISNPSTLDSASDLFAGDVTVTQVYLGYYQFTNQQIMQPVFVIEGNGRTKGGNTASGIFILPAIKN